MKGLNNHDVMQSALCTFIYASSPPHLSGDSQAFVRSAAEVALECQDFSVKVSRFSHLVSHQEVLHVYWMPVSAANALLHFIKD